MTVLGLIWAAFLPHYAVVHSAPSATPLQTQLPSAASIFASAYASGLHASDGSSRSHTYRPLHLEAETHRPLALRPQLDWPAAAVDWPRWRAAAAVTIEPGAVELPPVDPAAGCASAGVAEAGGTARYTIRVHGRAIGQVRSQRGAAAIAEQLRRAVPKLAADPNALIPSLGGTALGGQAHGSPVFVLPEEGGDRPWSALEATQWVNNLRLAFGGVPLDPTQVQMVAQGFQESPQRFGGTASWYGPYFHGRQTATGETFNQHDLTAAHKTLPFGTRLKVRNQLNGKTVVVRINDRGPYVGDRSLDLSYAAAQCLGSAATGVIPYEATVLTPGLPQAWQQATVANLP